MTSDERRVTRDELRGTSYEGRETRDERRGTRDEGRETRDWRRSGEKAMMDFVDLKVWQKARELCVEAYRISDAFPPKERFRLTDQMCRAAVSAVNNIAEGFGRGGGMDFA